MTTKGGKEKRLELELFARSFSYCRCSFFFTLMTGGGYLSLLEFGSVVHSFHFLFFTQPERDARGGREQWVLSHLRENCVDRTGQEDRLNVRCKKKGGSLFFISINRRIKGVSYG